MNHLGLGVVLTALFLVLCLLVQASGRTDWWGGPAIFAVMLALYWAAGRQLFRS
ncbi:hypothetical protein HJ590_04965 [Naumannella sp. ID2617S]|uniref:hypothetical protein n=1 Tax=Enemella dayhoffiae TaxID=2016507 RepID=UPI001489289C|nr:hypothetical protein [Enemella dayhoffiae]NNG18931.1 hypothetical protein [Naumannella sp. ID2617S]